MLQNPVVPFSPDTLKLIVFKEAVKVKLEIVELLKSLALKVSSPTTKSYWKGKVGAASA